MEKLLRCNLILYVHDVLWAELAGVADGAPVEVDERGAGTLDRETPDAHLAGRVGIASRRLQFQRANRAGRACPVFAERQVKLYDIALLRVDGGMALRHMHRHVGCWRRR